MRLIWVARVGKPAIGLRAADLIDRAGDVVLGRAQDSGSGIALSLHSFVFRVVLCALNPSYLVTIKCAGDPLMKYHTRREKSVGQVSQLCRRMSRVVAMHAVGFIPAVRLVLPDAHAVDGVILFVWRWARSAGSVQIPIPESALLPASKHQCNQMHF